MVRYSIEQRVFLVETYYWKQKSSIKSIRKFRKKFPDAPVPSRPFVNKLIKKWHKTGSLLDTKKEQKRSVLTTEKLTDIQICPIPQTDFRNKPIIMKKKYAGDESENEFSVDEPEELQGSDDDWTPAAGEGAGRRQSRRLRNSSVTKKPRLTEPSTSEEEEEEEEESVPSDEDSDSESQLAKKKGLKSGPKGRGRGKKIQVTSTSPGAKIKVAGETTVSCEATSTTAGSPATVVTPVEKEYTSGAFVVLKTDFQNGGDPPIWKIDGKALLQKYIPFEQDGKTLYKNTSTYSGWSANNKELYYPAPIAFKMQNRKETIVEFLRDSIKEEDSE